MLIYHIYIFRGHSSSLYNLFFLVIMYRTYGMFECINGSNNAKWNYPQKSIKQIEMYWSVWVWFGFNQFEICPSIDYYITALKYMYFVKCHCCNCTLKNDMCHILCDNSVCHQLPSWITFKVIKVKKPFMHSNV